MSLWADVQTQASGDSIKKEDEGFTIERITSYLRSLKVGPDGELPIRMFFFMCEDYVLRTIMLQSMIFSDGSRHYGSQENIKKFCELIVTYGKIKNLI